MSFSNMPASPTFYSDLCVVAVGLVLIGTGHPGACVEVRGCRVSPSTAWKRGTRDRTVVIRLGTNTDPWQWPSILYFSTIQHNAHKPCVIAEHFKSGWFISVLDNANIFLFYSVKYIP